MLIRIGLLILAIIGVSCVQLIMKFRFNDAHGEIPLSGELFPYFLGILKDPWMWLAGILLIASAFVWYFVISRMSLGVAFTFASLSYPLVMAGSYLFLKESFVLPQVMGCGLIVGGLCLIAAYS